MMRVEEVLIWLKPTSTYLLFLSYISVGVKKNPSNLLAKQTCLSEGFDSVSQCLVYFPAELQKG